MKRIYLFIIALFGIMGGAIMNAQDIPTGLVRVKSNRTSWYLSTPGEGTATTTAYNVNSLEQVWVLLADGNGYNLRSANTGEYLQASYDIPASGKVTLYIRKSPNATATKALFNISSDSEFGGKFLNTNTGHGLFTYSMDTGCDWYIETVENFEFEEIRQKLMSLSPYASELKDGAYYRIVSYYGMAMTAGNPLSTKNIDAANLNQYWQLTKSSTGWNIQAVVSQQYIQPQSATSTPFPLGNNKATFSITPVKDDWDYRWTIYTAGQTAGLHDAETQGHNVVRWSTDAAEGTRRPSCL